MFGHTGNEGNMGNAACTLRETTDTFYAGFGALFTPIYDTVFATVAPGQNGRAVAMNDLAMQGSAAIGIGVFTPWLASGSFESIAVVCVGAAAIGILGDWAHEALYRRGR